MESTSAADTDQDHFTKLPNEILSEILSHCQFDSIRSLCLVSHRCNQVATPALYSSPLPMGTWLSFGMRRTQLCRDRLKRLHRTLKHNEALRPLVRQLFIFTEKKTNAFERDILLHFLALVDGTKTLYLDADGYQTSFWKQARLSIQKMGLLSEVSIHGFPRAVIHMLDSLPLLQLQSLKILARGPVLARGPACVVPCRLIKELSSWRGKAKFTKFELVLSGFNNEFEKGLIQLSPFLEDIFLSMQSMSSMAWVTGAILAGSQRPTSPLKSLTLRGLILKQVLDGVELSGFPHLEKITVTYYDIVAGDLSIVGNLLGFAVSELSIQVCKYSRTVVEETLAPLTRALLHAKSERRSPLRAIQFETNVPKSHLNENSHKA